jgi:hypothetical protein
VLSDDAADLAGDAFDVVALRRVGGGWEAAGDEHASAGKPELHSAQDVVDFLILVDLDALNSVSL